MQLKDYIQGNRRGKDANRLEREAMNDPFLQEALDGFDNFEGNHIKIIDRLEKRFSSPAVAPQKNKKALIYWSMAASVLLLIGFYTFFSLERNIIFEQPAVVLLELQDSESEAAFDFPLLAQNQESQHEMSDIARTTQKAMPAPVKSLSALVVHDSKLLAETVVVADADYVSEESDVSFAMESFKEHIVVIQEEKQEKSDATGSISQINSENARKSESIQNTFGEKEFQTYCLQQADKTVCNGQGATVKISFFIDKTGKPSEIKWKSYSCENAKKEMENLLISSPVWTKTDRKITMTIEW